MENNIITILISAIVGAIFGRASVPAESMYYINMSKAIIRANKNLKTDRDKWKASAETERRIKGEYMKKLTTAISALEDAKKQVTDAERDAKAARRYAEELKERNLNMFTLMVKKGILTESELKSII